MNTDKVGKKLKEGESVCIFAPEVKPQLAVVKEFTEEGAVVTTRNGEDIVVKTEDMLRSDSQRKSGITVEEVVRNARILGASTKVEESPLGHEIGISFPGDHLWHWFDLIDLSGKSNIFFKHTYSQANGSTRKGSKRGFKLLKRLGLLEEPKTYYKVLYTAVFAIGGFSHLVTLYPEYTEQEGLKGEGQGYQSRSAAKIMTELKDLLTAPQKIVLRALMSEKSDGMIVDEFGTITDARSPKGGNI